jgi:hypothetical protein
VAVLVEGLPAAIAGIVLLFTLPDRPEDATWLTDDERRIVRERLAAERRPKEVKNIWAGVPRPARADPRRRAVRASSSARTGSACFSRRFSIPAG